MRTIADLFPHQAFAINKLLDNDHYGLLIDMGLGKTATVLTAFVYSLALTSGRASASGRALLVIGPKRVMETVWFEESREWSHTRRLKFSRILGSAAERLRAIHTPADVYLMNLDNVPWLANTLYTLQQQRVRIPFNWLTIDESDAYKDRSTRRFRGMCAMLPGFEKRNILTGTPTPNSLLDLWSQIYLLDQGQALGTYDTYSTRYFEFSEETGRREPKPGAVRTIQRAVSHLVLRVDNKKLKGMPKVREIDTRFTLPPEARRLYNEMEAQMFIRLDEIYDEIAERERAGQPRRALIEAVNAAVLTGKCHQIANGAIFDSEHRDVWHEVHRARLETLQEMLNEISSPVLISYTYRHDRERLMKMLPGTRFIGGGNKDTLDIVRLWNESRIDHLLVHPRSGGHGLNMQKGKGCTIIFFSNSWSRGLYDQLIARLARLGQQSDLVTVFRIVAESTVDEAMLERLDMRGAQQQSWLDSLRDYQRRQLNRAA